MTGLSSGCRAVSASLLALALAAHITVGAPLAPASGAVSGIVLHGATGDPLPSVRVTLARIDLPKGVASAFWEYIGNTPRTGLPAELTLPGKYLEAVKAQLDEDQHELDAARKNGDDNEADPSLAAGKALLKGLPPDEIHSILIDRAGSLSVVSTSSPPTLTDGAGRFRFQNVEPGLYRLIFSGNGLVREDYGQRGAGGGTLITVKSGQSVDGLTMRMTPTGSLSGRLTDNTGQPLERAPVELLRYSYDASGRRKARRVADSETNDRGEYRFYYLTPGRYAVKAGASPGPVDISPASVRLRRELGGGLGPCYESVSLDCPLRNPGPRIGRPAANRVDERYAAVYYPGTTDLEAAGAVDVSAGAEVSGIDLVLETQRLYRVRGRIVDPRTGAPPQSANVSLSPPGGGATFGAHYNPADGSFDVSGVPAGNYVLRGGLFGTARTPDVPKFAATVTVNADIEGLTPDAIYGSSLSGRVRIEPAAARVLRTDAVGIVLLGLGPDGAAYDDDRAPHSFNKSRPDGSFRFDGVLPGNYALHTVDNLPPGVFIKSVKVGDADRSNGYLTLPFSAPDATLEVVFSRTTAQIEGVVTAADGRPLSAAQVVLIPEGSHRRPDLFRSLMADTKGQFTIANIVPGSYKVVAWSRIEPFSWFDPAVLRQADEKGQVVEITEASKQTLRVTAFDTP